MADHRLLRPESWYALVCRPALPKDTADVLALTWEIWEGHDYVPYVWEEWLDDPDGLLAVAEYSGVVVGLGKLSRLAEGQWWLEGLRVNPDYQGRGIASRLHDYQVAQWQKFGGGALRLATASFRQPVQHLCERTGFEQVAEFTAYHSEPIPGGFAAGAGLFTPVSTNEVTVALEFARRAPPLTLSAGLMDLGWQWAAPSVELLGAAVERGQAWWWGLNPKEEKRGLLLINTYEGDEEDDWQGTRARAELLACRLDELVAMLVDYRCLAARLGVDRADWMAPLHPNLAPRLEAAGFSRDWEHSLYLYAREGPGETAMV